MIPGIITVIVILLSLQVFKKVFPIDPMSPKVSVDVMESLSDRYSGFFILYTLSSLPVFLGTLFLSLWLFQPYGVHGLVSLGIALACFTIVPKSILSLYAEKNGEEWFKGLKTYLDNRYKFNYFVVLRILLLIIYGMSVAAIFTGVFLTYFDS